MKKALGGEIGKTMVFRDYKDESDEHLVVLWAKVHSYLKIFGLAFLKFIFMLVGMGGLAGVIIIILKILFLSSISHFDMVLIFGIACLSIIAIRVGIYGFNEIHYKVNRQKTNIRLF